MTKSSISTESGLSGAIDQIENIVCGDIVAIINATGLGSLKLLGDETMYPIRGQTVLVKGVLGTGGLVTRLGKNKGKTIAIMPRQQENVTVVGVTREEGSWDVTEDTRTTAKLVEKAGEVVDVAGVKVLHAQIGLRPARRGGARVEVERVGKEEKFVIHAYGHAGAG